MRTLNPAGPRSDCGVILRKTSITSHIFLYYIFIYPICLEMLRMWNPQPAVGVGQLRHLDLPGVLGQAPERRSSPLLC